MRVLVCGGRGWGWRRTVGPYSLQQLASQEVEDYRRSIRVASAERQKTFDVLDHLHLATHIDVVIHGDAKGADHLGMLWAQSNEIQVLVFPADWRGLGRAAGPIRNQQMLDEGLPDLVVAFPGGVGTDDMKYRAEKANVDLMEVRL